MKFSQRQGFKPVSETIQVNGISHELRNTLWNGLDKFLWSTKDFMSTGYGRAKIFGFSHALWFHFLKRPVDERPDTAYAILGEIRKFFFDCEWYEIYDFLEWVVSHFGREGEGYQKLFNVLLERELAGYRFIDGKVVNITDQQEIRMLEEALADNRFSGATAHLKRALELLADRKAPDYRNSIKESISAVESVARSIANTPKATLGEALKTLERNNKIHSALKEGLLKLYGYTSDEQGIRHAMLDEPDVTQVDARFMLMSCTSFVNYLKAML